MPDRAQGPRPLGRGVLLAYGLPALPLAALLLPLYVTLPAFYAVDLGLGFLTVGVVLLLARLWDMVTDPVIGALSDRLTTRFGRRRPWMLAGAPLVMASAGYLFLPAPGAGWGDLLLWTMALYLGATMILLPYSAWGAELSPDYDERSRIAGWREGLVVVGTLLAAGLPVVVGSGRAAALEVIAWSLWVVLPVCLIVAVCVVPESPAAPPQRLAWRDGVRVLWRNGPFRRLIAAYFLNGIANGLPATLFLLYVERVLEAPDWSGALLFVYFFCGVAAIPLWLRLSARWGKHRTWVAAMVWAAAVFAFVPLLGAGDELWFLAVCVLTGVSLGADLTLPASMQADVIDLDTLRSRQRRAGLYFALWGVATKLALALAVGIAFPLLDLAGLETDPAAGRQAASAAGLWALAALYALVPALIKLGSVALVAGYPITAQRQRRIRRLIELRAARSGG
jgi:GPH family glycoside/pentoside/hexuronide:cation symporter